MTVRTTLAGPYLICDGKPLPVIGAELHNSSSSSQAAITASFRAVREVGATTVLAPVAWDLFEPSEGEFDTTLVDAMVETGRAEGLFLIPLWFGSWKNGMSTYVPSWVKLDQARFPRAVLRQGGEVEVVSPFSLAARDADAAAFAALMRRIREVDTTGVVIMVQVENEVGLLNDSRDRSVLAEEAWLAPVPRPVVDAVAAGTGRIHQAWVEAGEQRTGSWESAFGAAADEVFMAAAYASYVNVVAAAGRAELDRPLYANAWLDTPIELDLPDMPDWAEMAGGDAAGFYPSGGPLAEMAPVWRALAPSLDFLAPDIYFGDFDDVCQRYSAASGGRLFIPEMRRSPRGVGQMLRAMGEHRALGVAPFGVDSLLPGQAGYEDLKDGYGLLRAFAAAVRELDAPPTRGFLLTAQAPAVMLEYDDVTLRIDSSDPSGLFPPHYPAYGAVVQTGPLEFLVMGRGFAVIALATDGLKVGILGAAELSPDSGEVVRRFGGDETGSGAMVRLPALGAETPGVFPIPFDLRGTGIVTLRYYRYGNK